MSSLCRTVSRVTRPAPLRLAADACLFYCYRRPMRRTADEAGDKICLFGFSRGAYTARALAGMLHKVGLLPANNHQQIPFAYQMYSRSDAAGWDQSTQFKKAFSIDVTIEFIGVWCVPRLCDRYMHLAVSFPR